MIEGRICELGRRNGRFISPSSTKVCRTLGTRPSFGFIDLLRDISWCRFGKISFLKRNFGIALLISKFLWWCGDKEKYLAKTGCLAIVVYYLKNSKKGQVRIHYNISTL